MARRKTYTRGNTGEHMFTNPHQAASFVRDLQAKGAQVYGTRNAMKTIGIQPHHAAPQGRTDRRLPDEESAVIAEQLPPIQITFSPASTRVRGAGYDPVNQRMRLEWQDGGTPYDYHNVPPQVWESFQHSRSKGAYVHDVLDYFSYGRVDT